MIYPFLSLKLMMLLTGCLLVASHGFAFLKAEHLKPVLKEFPRSKAAGIALLTVVALWFLALVTTMDLGEFSVYRRMIQIVTVAAYVLSIRYRDEFLAVRALGALLLLAAETLIEPAFLRPESLRLLLVVLAYGWIFAGLFLVGMPYLMRDAIAWASERSSRWTGASLAGVAYGIALLIAGVMI